MTKIEQSNLICNYCKHSAHCGHGCVDETCDHCPECACDKCQAEQNTEHERGYN